MLTLAILAFSPICLWMHILRSSRTPIELISVSLERSECLVSRTLNNLKCQQSDQKLWPWEEN